MILWRHGQTDYNIQLRVQGGVDIPLNATGVQQAAAGAEALARYLGDDARVSIVSSTLSRAAATARALADVLALTVATDARLRERDFGIWEGLTHDQMVERWPEEFRLWKTGAAPGGHRHGNEVRQVADRVHAAVMEHATAHAAGEILVVVSHGSATTRVLARMLGARRPAAPSRSRGPRQRPLAPR